MLRDELLDVLSTEGKQAGGYCTSIMDYEVPFIFANFNGTQHDVEVVTHEAGHAFEAWTNRKRIPIDYIWPSMEPARSTRCLWSSSQSPGQTAFSAPTRRSSSTATSPAR